MEKGISVFLGMGASLEQIFQYLELASGYGYSRLFTSLHIPEANSQELLRDFQQMNCYAAQLGFRITADISPHTFQVLGISPDKLEAFKNLGLHTLRLDFGFQTEQTLALAKGLDCEIELNASIVNEELLQELLAAGIAPERLRACHNYYPRPETGLSYEHLIRQSQLFRSAGIPVLAFIPSRKNPRGPIYEGLPTLERHRELSAAAAAKDFLFPQVVDGILFGDPFADKGELAAVANLSPEVLLLKVETAAGLTLVEREILFADHTNRKDPGEWVIRSQEGRGLCKREVAPQPPQLRKRGAVTIDNKHYLRYMGELQVVRQELPASAKVNVVAQVAEEELFLLERLLPGGRFGFVE